MKVNFITAKNRIAVFLWQRVVHRPISTSVSHHDSFCKSCYTVCSMTRRVRRIIFFSFTLLFISIAPLIVLYSSGYRFSAKKRSFVKTGALFLESYPKEAEIFINRKKYKRTTPTHVPRLVPNQYLITIRKSGYQPWNNIIEVRENQTTFIQHVQLFRTDPPVSLLRPIPTTSPILISPDRSLLAWQEETSITIHNTNTKGERIIPLEKPLSSSRTTRMSWSASGKYLFLANPPHGAMVETETGDLSNILLPPSSRVFPHPLQDSSLIIASPHGVATINSLTKKQEPIIALSSPIQSTIPSRQGIYYIISPDSNPSLLRAPYSINKKPEHLASLPAGTYEGELVSEDLLSIRNAKNGDLFFFSSLYQEREKKGLIGPFSRVQQAVISPNKNTILLVRERELSLLSLPLAPESKEEILLRISSPITAAAWLPDSVHVLWASEGILSATEIFRASQRNSWQLASFEDIAEIQPAKSKKEIYLKALKDGQWGIFLVKIQ